MKKNNSKILELEKERLVPPEDKNKLFYDEHLARYLFACQFVRGKRVLDAACGTGYGSWLLAKARASEVWGVDNSEEAISYARSNYEIPGIFFHLWNLEKKLPVADRSFDIIVSFETLEHLRNQTQFLTEVKRILKKNGILILSSPNPESDPRHVENPFHKRVLTEEELEKLLAKIFPHWLIIPQRNRFIVEIGLTRDRGNLIKAKGIQIGEETPLGDYVDTMLIPSLPAYFIAIAGEQRFKIPERTLRLLFDNLQLLELSRHLKFLNEKVLSQSKELKKKDRFIGQLKSDLEAKKRQLKVSAAEKDKIIAELGVQLEAKKKEVNEYFAKLNKIYHSKTWRLLWIYKQITSLPIKLISFFRRNESKKKKI